MNARIRVSALVFALGIMFSGPARAQEAPLSPMLLDEAAGYALPLPSG